MKIYTNPKFNPKYGISRYIIGTLTEEGPSALIPILAQFHWNVDSKHSKCGFISLPH